MTPEKNLIKDYCIQNKVAISFKDADQLDIIMGLFDEDQVKSRNLFIRGGMVSFYKFDTDMGRVHFRVRQSQSREFEDHAVIKAEEFFTLALPNRSILEYIK